MQLSRSMLEVVVIQNTKQVAEYVYAQNKLYILVYTIFQKNEIKGLDDQEK